MRVLIIDYGPMARFGVVHRLRQFKDVEIVGEWEMAFPRWIGFWNDLRMW